MSERLEIEYEHTTPKGRHYVGFKSKDDYERLIQRAELVGELIFKNSILAGRAEELESILETNKSVVNAIVGEETLHQDGEYESEMMRLQKQNHCYKQALEEIVEAKENYYGDEYPDAVDDIATGALEGESE
ncbi:hypothetical protein [Virgibacillus sp. CBA3643]|uniref:hypothetical protein n=1 Tax=Virgibacillus sp. CBA3643 TaxID=2942278 RepID=UPI0035A384E6